MLMQCEYHTLPYKYPRYYRHTLTVKFLVIYELIDKLLGALSGDHDGVDGAIDCLIVGINKGSKATCKKKTKAVHRICLPHSKVGIKVRLDCSLFIIQY